MGLLGNGWDDPQSQGLLALAAGMMSGNLSKGVSDMNATLAGAQDAALKRKLLDAQISNFQSEAEARRAQAAAALASASEKERIRAAVANAGRVAPGMGAGLPNGTLLPEFSTGQSFPALQQSGRIDAVDLIRQGVPIETVKALMEAPNYGRSKVARTVETEGPGGAKIVQGFDDYGQPVGQGVAGYLAPQLVNQGDRQTFVKPSAGVSLPMGQSPDSKASNALGWANYGLSKQRLDMEKSDPKLTWNQDLGGFVDPRTRRVLPALDAQGNQIAGAGPRLTEDQGKATGWLVQAATAFDNMKAATRNTPSAARPGFNDALAAIPSMGLTSGIANMMRGEDRQKYMQASSSFSEAVLRAATGAGVNKDEAAQKVRELTPVMGDSDAVIAQKEAAMQNYLESLKVRAGPGAKQADAILRARPVGAWSITKE